VRSGALAIAVHDDFLCRPSFTMKSPAVDHLRAVVIELAETTRGNELGVVAELRHHRHAEERDPQHVERHGAFRSARNVGEGVRHGLDAPAGLPALPR